MLKNVFMSGKMRTKKMSKKFFKINGIIETPNEIDVDVFCDKFIDFVESNGWIYGGGFCEVDENGDDVALNEGKNE